MRNPQIFRRAFLLAAAGIVVVGAVSALRPQPLLIKDDPKSAFTSGCERHNRAQAGTRHSS